MDLAEIQRQARAAREFVHVVDGASFQLRLPTRLDSRLLMARVMATPDVSSNDSVLAIRVERASVEQAVFGWTGVPLSWVLPPDCESDGELSYEPGAIALLLDERPAVAEALGQALFARMAEFNERLDTAAKN